MELKIRTCKGPRNIRPDGTKASYRAVCGSTNVKLSQPSDMWITYYCLDCFWTNIELASSPTQLRDELEDLMANREAVFGAMGDEPPADMPDNVVNLFQAEARS